MISLASRIGVIAGATGFLGSLLAEHYSSLGVSLILIGRDAQKIKDLERDLKAKSDSEVKTLIVDFEGDYISYLHEELAPYKNQIDFFICAIGDQQPIGPTVLTDQHEWIKSIHTNLIVPVNLVRLFAGFFVDNSKGSIIVTSGGGATKARPNFSAYASGKAGLVRFVETLAEELIETQIRINAIAPGVLPSRMMNEILNDPVKAGLTEVELARNRLQDTLWDKKKVMSLCDFLISDLSNGVSGKLISAHWDNWAEWPKHINDLMRSDLYTLRRIVGRDRGQEWGDV